MPLLLAFPTADEQPECVIQSTLDALALPRQRAWAPRDPDPEDGWVTVATPEAAQAAQEAAQAAQEAARAAQEAAQATPEQWLAQLGKRRRSRAKSAAAHRVSPDQLPLW